MRLDKSLSVILDDTGVGNVSETMYLLDVGAGHSIFQKDIDIIPNYDTNAKRWELFTAENDFDVITNQFPGYWKYVRDTKTFKSMILARPDISGATGGPGGTLVPPLEYITSLTNEHEFAANGGYLIHELGHSNTPVDTNFAYFRARVANGSVMSPKSKLYFSQKQYRVNNNSSWQFYYGLFEYDEETHTLKMINPQNTLAGSLNIGLNKYLTVATNKIYLTDKDDSAITVPSVAENYNIGATRCSEQEKIAFGAPHTSDEFVLYNTETKEAVNYKLPAAVAWGANFGAITTDYQEKYCVIDTSLSKVVFADMSDIAGTIREIDLSLPVDANNIQTKWALSPDGTMLATTGSVVNTPLMRIYRLSDGEVIYTSAINQACNSVIWTKENKIFVNSITNVMSRFEVSGTATNIVVNAYNNYISGTGTGQYMMHYIPSIDMIVGVKQVAANGQPLWYFLNTITNSTIGSAEVSNLVGTNLSVGARNYCHVVPHDDDSETVRIIISPTVVGNWTVVEYNPSLRAQSETKFSTTVAQLASNYQISRSPAFFLNNRIVVMQVAINYLIAYDLVAKKSLFTFDLNPLGTLKHLDDNHFAWEGNTSAAIYRVNEDFTITEKIKHVGPAMGVYLGFDGDSDINLLDN